MLRTACIFMLLSTLLCAQEIYTPGEKNVTPSSAVYDSSALSSEPMKRFNTLSKASKKDLEIALLKNKEKEEHVQVKLWFSLTVVVLLASFVIICLIVKHQKKRRSKVEAEKKLKERELEETKNRLYHNVKLVDGFTQRILDKNKVIAELEKKIRSNPLWNQSAENARKNLAAINQLRILTNDDWNKFQSNVNKVYPGLINHIRDSFPLITDAELRMFLLIKLSVKNKDISEILGISPDSVRKTRFRLKKKLNLSEEADLDDFISNYNGNNSVMPQEEKN